MRACPPLRTASFAILLVLAPAFAHAAPRALFDNAHAETAGNADWEIDTDQPLPVPDQNTVTASTPRTTWVGAISSWGIDLVKRGYSVATLTSAYGITYGNAGNPYDLSKYDVFIVPEPNTRFTAAESTAIFNFVRDGGGLVLVSDHSGSDRNGDGYDSPQIFDLLDTQHLFGVHFGSTGDANNNIVQNSGNVETSPADSIIHGPNGVADSVSYHNGTTLTLYPGVNPTVTGDIWMNGLAHGTTGLMAAHAVYGNGRIFFAGDSSPIDDGSAAPGNSSIFDGWGEAGGRDSLLFQNATMWATRRAADTTPPSVAVSSPNGGETWKAGSTHIITWTASDAVGVTTVDIAWSSDGGTSWPNAIATGIANNGSLSWTVPNAPTGTARVRVTAHDAASNAGADASDASFTIDTWTISATAGSNGTIAPGGNVPVVEGASQGFTITPTAGYAISSLTVDGNAIPPASTYTFTQVAANHTIQAGFGDAQAPMVAVIAPNGGERWPGGSTHDITWTASDNAGVDSLDVDVSYHGADGPWLAIAHGLTNSGTYAWTVADNGTDSALVRVTARDGSGNASSDASDSLFDARPAYASAPPAAPPRFAFAPPAPNPAAGPQVLRFSLAVEAVTRLEILDLSGRSVRTLVDSSLSPGDHRFVWDGVGARGQRVRAGLYFVRLTSGTHRRVARIARL